MRKSAYLPDYERIAVEKVLKAVYAYENPTYSEQVISAMVNREVDNIIRIRKLQDESKEVTRKISEFAETLADFGISSLNAETFDINAGRMFIIQFVLPKRGCE
jgi:hypothetical protein